MKNPMDYRTTLPAPPTEEEKAEYAALVEIALAQAKTLPEPTSVKAEQSE